MKVIVTGVHGQLGHDVVDELRRQNITDILALTREMADITNEQQIKQAILNFAPDAIVHCAAYTAVDKAEDNVDECYNTNVLATKYITEAAKQVNAKMVYVSTDYVFDGKGDKFYDVDDVKSPLSVYGKTKFLGEMEALKNDKHFIVRTSWVFGLNGNNFVKTMLKLANTRQEVNVVNDQIGSPTYTVDLAKLLVEMIKTNRYGVYHATNQGICSWAEFAAKIFELAKLPVRVNKILTSQYPTRAVRPLNSRLSKRSLNDAGFNLMPDWLNALERYINELDLESFKKF